MIGGSISISAGSSDGQSESDQGGSLKLSAGNANGGGGGSIDVTSGESNYESSMYAYGVSLYLSCICGLCNMPSKTSHSVYLYLRYIAGGHVAIQSSNAGEFGPSGSLFFSTGDVTKPKRTTHQGNDSGDISIVTGSSQHGFGGDIKLTSGDGFGDFVNDKRGGGSISLTAGDTTGHRNAAGSVNIMAGWGHQTSGDVRIHTPKSTAPETGNIIISTGATYIDVFC